jgi:hypothetical protein
LLTVEVLYFLKPPNTAWGWGCQSMHEQYQQQKNAIHHYAKPCGFSCPEKQQVLCLCPFFKPFLS